MADIILIAVLIALIGSASFYVYRAKKSGQACIGCPHSKTCGSKTCGCGCNEDSE